jgi:hypothetical protein
MNQVDEFYIDIETIPSPEPPPLPEMKIPGNYKKEETILKFKEEWGESAEAKRQELWAKESLNAIKGRIFCIGYAINDLPTDVVYDINEENMMIKFNEVVKTLSFPIWIGHNLSDFDLLWLYLRALKYNLSVLKYRIPQDGRNNMIFDTMKKFTGAAYWRDNRFSLNDVCTFLGVPAKTEMHGSQVFDYYKEGKIDEILKYCAEDVDAVRQVYKIIKG